MDLLQQLPIKLCGALLLACATNHSFAASANPTHLGSLMQAVLNGAAASDSPAEAKQDLLTLLDFSDGSGEPRWITVNDDVMGGRSNSAVRIEDGKLQFNGRLSLENNGGFASIRTLSEPVNLLGTTAFVLRVLGDGREYQLRIATAARFRGSAISYGASFKTTAGQWLEVVVPVTDLKPSFRGFALSGPELDLADVREIGLLIGDYREDAFALTVDWIKRQH